MLARPCNTGNKFLFRLPLEISTLLLLESIHWIRSSKINKDPRINTAIRANSLRVIGDDGRQLGILSKTEALAAAAEAGMDLVEVSPDASPPVAKIVDWGKYNYQRTKQLQKSRSKAKPLDVKQMRFGLKISEHDLSVKLRKVEEFLEAGHKVKITVIYRGRELAHKELGFQLADKVIDILGDSIHVDQQPQFAGRQLNFVVRSTNHAKVKNA
jgi:translation initiation factor IF-3